LPSGREDGVERGLAKVLFDGGGGHAIDARTQSLRGDERIGGVLRSRVYTDGLRACGGHQR